MPYNLRKSNVEALTEQLNTMAETQTQPQNVFHLTPNVTVTHPVTADIPTFDLNTTEKENIEPDVAEVFNSTPEAASGVSADVNNAIMAEEQLEDVSQDIQNIALEENHQDDNVTVATEVTEDSQPPVMIPHKALLSITRRLEILEEENKYLKKKVRKINNHVVASMYQGSGSEEDPIIIQ